MKLPEVSHFTFFARETRPHFFCLQIYFLSSVEHPMPGVTPQLNYARAL
jgi:hypothetical protein